MNWMVALLKIFFSTPILGREFLHRVLDCSSRELVKSEVNIDER